MSEVIADAEDPAIVAARNEKLAILQAQADAAVAGIAALRKAFEDPANSKIVVPDTLLQIAEVLAAKPETAFSTLLALVHAEYETQNDLHNVRMKKLETLQGTGTNCPADLATLDAVKV